MMAQKPRRDRRRISQVAASDLDVGSEPFESKLPVGSGMDTAAIGEVTPAMMDEAAHKAAEAVDAAAHHVVIQEEHGDGEHGDEPVPQPMTEAATVTPIRSESDVSAAEPGPSESLAAAVPPVEIASTGVRRHGESVEEAPALTLPPLEAIEPSAPVDETAGLVTVEANAAGEALAGVADEMAPPADLPASPTETLERTGETLRRSLPLPGETIGAYGAQVVGMLAANMAANGQFLTALMGATSVTEVVAVNTHHFRRQMELLTTQGRQLTTLARTITLDAMKPFSPSSTDH